MNPNATVSHNYRSNESELAPLSAALMLIDNGEFKLAEGLLRSELLKNPRDLKVIRWLGYCLSMNKDFVAALTCFKECARLNPSEETYFNLAEAYLALNKREMALANYQLALSRMEYESPKLFEIYKNLGNIYLSFSDIEAAEEHYNRAFALNPHSDVMYVNYGTLEIQRNQYKLAAERFEQALELNQSNEKAWIGLSISYHQLADLDLAIGAVEKALDIEPTNQLALKLLVEWSLESNNSGSVIARLNSYLAKFPMDHSLSYALAVLLFRSGHLEEAEFEADKACLIDPSSTEAFNLKKMIRERMELESA